MGWWCTYKNLSLLKMKNMEDSAFMGMGMEGTSPGSKEHGRGYDVTDDVLEPFKNDLSLSVLHEPLEFDLQRGGNEKDVDVEWSVTLVSTAGFVDCHSGEVFDREEDKEGHPQNLYSNTVTIFLVKATEQLIGNFRVSTEFWAEKDFFTAPNGELVNVEIRPTTK